MTLALSLLSKSVTIDAKPWGLTTNLALGTALCAVAPTMNSLILARAVAGAYFFQNLALGTC
jgi:hypothetical protein